MWDMQYTVYIYAEQIVLHILFIQILPQYT